MGHITDEQVDLVLRAIIADGVTDRNLQNDLLDHYCCHIGAAMDAGIDFDTAYANAFHAITPNGMHEIQEELFFLLTFKTQTSMKRIIFGFGFLAAFLVSAGLLFKTTHWPHSTGILFSGFCALTITSLALFINSLKYRKLHPLGYNVRTIVGFVSAFPTAVGSIFKILHYPGANILMESGMVLLTVAFIPMLFWQMYKQSLALK